MADKELTQATTAKTEPKAKQKSDKPKEKKPNIFVRMGRAIAKFFREHWSECQKVIWPDFRTVVKNTLVVFVVVFVIGIGIWICDFAVSELLSVVRAAFGA